jgi:hypothetical protein
MRKSSYPALCEAHVGRWPHGVPETCSLPARYYLNKEGGWPAYYKLCDEHKALAEQREGTK